MCGFSDVRRKPDGEYYCQVCGKNLGKDFRDRLKFFVPKKTLRELDRQSSQATTTQENK